MEATPQQQQQAAPAPAAAPPTEPSPRQRESTARLRFQLPVLARLQAEEDAQQARRAKSTKRSRRADRNAGWSKATTKTVLAAVPEGEVADESDKLGRDRRRRFLNDKLLREMAGALTAADMEALFQPVPFGVARLSAFSQVARPDAAPLWDLFRSVDEDRQNATLRALEQRLQQERAAAGGAAPAQPSGGLAALKSWARIPRKQREALKRCDAEAVEALELPICEFLDREREPGAALELEPDGPHQRLLCHGLAAFHGLRSGATLAGGLRLSRPKGSPPASSPAISCADVVFALEADPAAGLTPQQLDAQWRRQHYGTDGDSEASYVVV